MNARRREFRRVKEELVAADSECTVDPRSDKPLNVSACDFNPVLNGGGNDKIRCIFEVVLSWQKLYL